MNKFLNWLSGAAGLHAPPAGCQYPNGSVPYSDDSHDPGLRRTRWACATRNHQPRTYNGSWCMGYGYVCSRCFMYADPWSKKKMALVVDRVNQMGREGRDFYPGDICR